ncbi:MAG: cobalamin-dependent protein, partial [Promethearchaeota archaeon]
MPDLDILFIHPPIRFQRHWTRFKHSEILQVPMGMPALADLCQQQGLKTRILNIPLELNIDAKWDPRAYLKNNPARVYAIDIHWFATSHGAIQTTKLCKAIQPDASVLLGGSTATIFAKEILKTYSAIDAVIRGETEEPILKYLEAIEGNPRQLQNVPNLSFRESSSKVRENPISYIAKEEDINALNFTNLTMMEHSKEYFHFLERYMPFGLMVARGCPFNCPLCAGGRDSLAHYWKRRKTTLRDPVRVAEDIASIAETHLTSEVYFGHGIYPATQKYWLRLFKEVRTKRNLTYAVSAGQASRRDTYGMLYVTAVEPDTTIRVMLHEVH